MQKVRGQRLPPLPSLHYLIHYWVTRLQTQNQLTTALRVQMLCMASVLFFIPVVVSLCLMWRTRPLTKR